MSYLYTTRKWTLKFTHCGESWEDLWLSIYADAGECGNDDEDGRPGRAVSGYFLVLEGANGAFLPLGWLSKRQTVPTTSSGEAEAIAWCTAAKAGMKVASMLELLRRSPVTVRGFVDNEALRISILHGSSQRMGHLKKLAGVHFGVLQASELIPTHVEGAKNTADLMTKVLGKCKIRQLVERIYRIDLMVLSGDWSNAEEKEEVRVGLAGIMVRIHSAWCPLTSFVDLGTAPLWMLNQNEAHGRCTCRAVHDDIEEAD
jgi:hypothetical protein